MAADYKVLRVGMRFWFDGQVYTCLSINASSATVKCSASKVVTIATADGTERTFTARSGRTTHVSSKAFVQEVNE